MYHNYTDEELRSFCRSSIESLEMWARRLIHDRMISRYGQEYIRLKISEENFLIKKDVREHVQRMMEKEPGRFPREVDTLFFEHIMYFLCKPEFYRDLFGEALRYAYPQGIEEARTFLSRLVPIRNALSHANPISIRQAEQAICYSHDLVDGIKNYYKDKGLEQVWNVPRIIRVTDSLGNTFDNPTDGIVDGKIFKLTQDLRCGDIYSVRVDIDSSFSDDEYDIFWKNGNSRVTEFDDRNSFTVTFGEEDVAEIHTIDCIIKSHKSWHKYRYHDCKISLMFTVLPPV